ncbi:hypothetical protein BDV93DRAFT_164050 [Ceratobasidium sp. AG-I]|nr:hypothetical protein BDV93DRAFT_164050 [Ceratobasidium sp. AG-I]
MMSRVLSPPAMIPPASSIAQLNQFVAPADSIPALGFARSGNELGMTRPGASASGSGSGSTMWGANPYSMPSGSSYRIPHTHESKDIPLTSRHMNNTFNTSMRSAETRYNPLTTRKPSTDTRPLRAPNPSDQPHQPGPAPNNQVETIQPARVTFSPAPLVHLYPAPQSQPRSQSPGVLRNPYARSSSSGAYVQPRSNSTDAAGSSYSYPAASEPASSLAPPSSGAQGRRRSPSPLTLSKLDTEAKAREGQLVIANAPNNNTTSGQSATSSNNAALSSNAAGKAPENRQAIFIDSPIDYYSRLDSKVSALPSDSTFSIGPLVSITSVPPTPEYNQQSFSTAQTSPPQFAIRSQAQPPVQHQYHAQSSPTSSAYPPSTSYSYAHAYPQQQSQTIVRSQRQPQPQTLRMCVVCFDTEPDIRFAERSPSAKCGHGASVCTSCLERHILVITQSVRSVDVRCPHDGCGKKLEYKDIYASVRDWGQLVFYEALLLRKDLENDERFVWCKNTQCKSGQLHKGGKARPVVTCTTCYAKSCFKHDRPWHDDMTCDEFDQKLKQQEEAERKATDKYLATHTKTCPNEKCGRKIERNGGCDHMLCRPPGGCGHEFCWQCLGDAGKHKPECAHFSPPRRRARRALV